MSLWHKFMKLFAQPVIVPSVNRKERRARDSIARRQPNLPVIKEEQNND